MQSEARHCRFVGVGSGEALLTKRRLPACGSLPPSPAVHCLGWAHRYFRAMGRGGTPTLQAPRTQAV